MKIEQQFSEPEHVKRRQPYRLRIEGRDGQAIEIVEQMGGSFSVTSVTTLNTRLVITPVGCNRIIVEAKPW